MRVVLFGATGMIGQGVLRACFQDPEVTEVLTVGRRATGQADAKLREIIHADLLDLSAIERELTGFDAGFFCVGVSSVGMNEDDYRRITHDLTLAVAGTLAKNNPKMTFIYVSGAGASSSEKSLWMWARVRGRTENDLLRLPFKATFIFRPAYIHPLEGIRSPSRLTRFAYAVTRPIYPALKTLFPGVTTTTEMLGRAMLNAVRHGSPRPILESADINRLGLGAAGA